MPWRRGLTSWTRPGLSGWRGRAGRRWSTVRRRPRPGGSARRWGCGGAPRSRTWPTWRLSARESARLEELRLVALEGRIEAEIELGLAAEAAGELEGLVAEHRLRERLWRLLVLALYRCGRQADALAAYRRARAVLAEELGIEPGEELRALEQAVLRQQVPAAAPRRAQHNLPARLTSFLGREQELAALDGLVAGARLVTVTGAGGAGKTRLAVEFAAAAAARFGDGAWLAELAGITDPGLVPAQVMAALGVRQTGEMPVIEALRYRLRSAELLLVLDNCEHLPGACGALAADLLGGCPGLRVLATSREPLGVPGEAVFPLPPLAVPPDGSDAQVLASAPAVRLFLARSALARPGAAAAPAEVVARICRALDGLPLAIELAAARAGVLSAEEIQARLADLFRFLASPRPAADPRHQALGAAIGWSYELLTEPERRGFRALSVFAGGFALAEAAAVCCGGDQAAALDLVDVLAGKSLVVAEPASGGTRYQMLETIRQYAARPGRGRTGPGPARRGVPAAGGAAMRAAGSAARAGQFPRRPRPCPSRRRRRDRAAARPCAGRVLAGPRIVPGGASLAGTRARRRPGRPAAARRPAPAARGAAIRGRGHAACAGHPGGGPPRRRGGRRAIGAGPDPRPAGRNPTGGKSERCRGAGGMRRRGGTARLRQRPGGHGRSVAYRRQGALRR